MQIITLLPIWKLLFNEPHPPKRFPRLGRRTAVTRSRPQIFISNVNILMSVALCKWIFMDIHEFIKLLLVETKHEWGSLNSDYSPPLTLADPCSHRSTPAVGFDSSRCTELQEQVLLYTKWKKIDTKLMWTHSLESSRANTRNIHSCRTNDEFMSSATSRGGGHSVHWLRTWGQDKIPRNVFSIMNSFWKLMYDFWSFIKDPPNVELFIVCLG